MNEPLPQRKRLPHTAPSWVADGAVYFITINTLPRNKNQLCHDDIAEAILSSMEFNLKRGIWWPHLVLLMPDHLHGLMSFAPDPGIKKSIEDWKHYISRHHELVWQRDFFDHRLRREESYVEKAEYIRQNPGRADRVASAEDWPYVREWPTLVTFAER